MKKDLCLRKYNIWDLINWREVVEYISREIWYKMICLNCWRMTNKRANDKTSCACKYIQQERDKMVENSIWKATRGKECVWSEIINWKTKLLTKCIYCWSMRSEYYYQRIWSSCKCMIHKDRPIQAKDLLNK